MSKSQFQIKLKIQMTKSVTIRFLLINIMYNQRENAYSRLFVPIGFWKLGFLLALEPDHLTFDT